MIFLFSGVSFAQKSDKDLKKNISAKASKEARKQAKKQQKDGYYTFPGDLPMEKQFEKFWKKRYETDQYGMDRYITSNQRSVAETQIAAQMQAMEVAKLEIAGQIQSNIAALIENNIANAQLNTEEAASVTKTVAASKNIIAQELGRVYPDVKLYKDIGKNIEVNVWVSYDVETGLEIAKKTIRKNLEDRTDILQEKLEKLMGF